MIPLKREALLRKYRKKKGGPAVARCFVVLGRRGLARKVREGTREVQERGMALKNESESPRESHPAESPIIHHELKRITREEAGVLGGRKRPTPVVSSRCLGY